MKVAFSSPAHLLADMRFPKKLSPSLLPSLSNSSAKRVIAILISLVFPLYNYGSGYHMRTNRPSFLQISPHIRLDKQAPTFLLLLTAPSVDILAYQEACTLHH